MDRIDTWYHTEMAGCDSEYDLAAGLGNGDIARPEWLGYNEGNNTIWDTGESDGRMGLRYLDVTPPADQQ